MLMVAMVRGYTQEFDLLPVTRTPEAHREMNPQSDSTERRQRMVKRVGLQADGLFAIGRKRTKGFNEPIHD